MVFLYARVSIWLVGENAVTARTWVELWWWRSRGSTLELLALNLASTLSLSAAWVRELMLVNGLLLNGVLLLSSLVVSTACLHFCFSFCKLKEVCGKEKYGTRIGIIVDSSRSA